MKKRFKQIFCIVFALVLCCTSMLTGFAATGFQDERDENNELQSTHYMVYQYTRRYYNIYEVGHALYSYDIYFCEHCRQIEEKNHHEGPLEVHVGDPCVVCNYETGWVVSLDDCEGEDSHC